MAHSNLLGGDEVPVLPPGHDTATLGPSDTSDNGSDLVGLVDRDDPGLAVDTATAGEHERAETSVESIMPGVDTDAAGTGERRSAGGDAGAHEAADIGPDSIIRGPDADPDIDDNRPLFEDYPEEDDVGNEDYVDNLPPEDEEREESDSLDYHNAVFRRRDNDMP